MITHDAFIKLDIRISTITAADKVAGADKLIRLEIDLGGSYIFRTTSLYSEGGTKTKR
jgi:tRNA-binding EMAP/Myf-like protein